MKQFAEQGKLANIDYAKASMNANFAPVWSQLGTIKGHLYGIIFKASNKSLLWYNVPAFKAAGVTAPKTWADLHEGREHAEGLGRARVLDRRVRRLDAHRPVREHLSPHVRAGEVPGAERRTRSSGRTRR